MAADDTSPEPTETVGDGPPPEPIEAVEGNLPPGLIEALESLGDAPHGQLMEVMAIFDQTMDEVIPAKALISLPFKAEPLANWNMAGDLGQFMCGLYSARVGALLADGTSEVTDITQLASDVFDRERERATKMGELFRPDEREIADQSSAEQYERELGRALKYFAAWDAAGTAVLEEPAFTSLPHLLEGTTDLECALNLLASHFYKQVSQVLRGFLESQIVDLSLALDDEAFAAWKAGNYRVPNLRGRDGLLKKLVDSSVLSLDLKHRIELAYEELNASVHGAERTMINSGLFSSEEQEGLILRKEKFLRAVEQLSTVVEICLHTLRIKTVVWANALKSDTERCEVCRERTLGSLPPLEFAGKNFIARLCQTCGRRSFIKEETKARVYPVYRVWKVTQHKGTPPSDDAVPTGV